MRKVALGAVPVRGCWSPNIKTERRSMRPRKPVKDRGNKQFPSYYPTIKGPVRMERLRRHFHFGMANILDARHDVLVWTAETDPVEVQVGDETIRFTPDFKYETEAGTRVVRLLHRRRGSSEDTEVGAGALRAACAARGITLDEMTREELEAHPSRRNADDFFYYRQLDWPPHLPLLANTLFRDGECRTLGELMHALGGDRHAWASVLSLAANGYLLVDISNELDRSAPILACRTRGWRA